MKTTGEPGHGLMLVLSGEAATTHRGPDGEAVLIVSPVAGDFIGELSQISGRPALVDVKAETEVQAVLIPPERLQALFVEEAELGERILRALILRRMVLLERGVGGPILVGRRGSADVLRLSGFLARNAHPQQSLDPDDETSGAATLIEKFKVAPEELPIVL